MNKTAIIFSILVTVIITSILILSILFIILFYWGDVNALKDSMSIVSSLFGGLTTLGAAVVAATLFDDWRIIHNKNSLKELALEVHKTYNNLNVKLISINDIFVKSAIKNKINNSYNTVAIADEIEQEVKEVGDYLAMFLHQLNFIDALQVDKNGKAFLDEVEDTLLKYMSIMDISEYRKINNHELFITREANVKDKFDNLRDPLIQYLKNFILIDFT